MVYLDKMELYSISQLSRFSGIKPHTIRAWEKRYRALKPHRSDGNTRYYDTVQTNRLMLLVGLVKAGYKASEVGGLPDEKLRALLESVYTANRQTEEYFISLLIAAGLSYDTARFERVYEACVSRYRLKKTYQTILLPMLERVGLMWRCDKASPAQEHFISNLLRKKLFAAVDALPWQEEGTEKWLLFLPENEFHEIGLLMGYNLIRLSGHRVIYLGANVPWAALPGVIRETRPDNLLFFNLFQTMSKSALVSLHDLATLFTGDRIYAAGLTTGISQAVPSSKVQLLTTIEDLIVALTRELK